MAEDDRLARAEARLAGHDATFRERERAETQAQRERELSAAAVQAALEEARTSSAEALKAALESANKLEEERIGRVEDEIQGVKNSSIQKAELQRRAQDKFESTVAGEFAKMNEFRNALEDLGKGMATRRELEVGIGGLDTALGEHSKQLADLRTLVAVGPTGLPELKTRADESTGEQRALLREKQAVIAAQNRQIMLVGTVVGALSLIAYLLFTVNG